MAIPNFSAEVKRLYDTGLFDLKSHDGQGAFVDACVSMLHGIDANFGHLIKKPGQTDVHDHGEDSALYKLPNNKAQAVDFIGGAGGTNPQPGWIVDSVVRYTYTDWADPTDHGITESSAPAPSFPYPDENGPGKVFQDRVDQAYADAHRPFPDPNDRDAFRHFMRYGYSSHEMPEPQAADKHIAELRAQLGV